jgi:hypothetical protein
MASNCSLTYSSAPFSSTGRCAFWHVLVRATYARGRFRGGARSVVRVQRCQEVDWSVVPFAQANYRALTGRFALLVVDCSPIRGRLMHRFESVAHAARPGLGKYGTRYPFRLASRQACCALLRMGRRHCPELLALTAARSCLARQARPDPVWVDDPGPLF